MATNDDHSASDSEQPTVVSGAAGASKSLWSKGDREASSDEANAAEKASAAKDAAAEKASAVKDAAAEKAGVVKDAAAEKAGAVKDAAAEKASAAKDAASEKAGAVKEVASEKAGAAKEAAASIASSARERVAAADVNEIAASTSKLIDTARPFFLLAFSITFTILAFLEDHSSTSVVFALGAILFVIGAAFSVEIDAILTRRTERKS